MERLNANVYVHTIVTHGFGTNCAVIVGADRAFVFDTLDGPEGMQPVVDLLATEAADRRVMVINSHHHWDHVYGNCAFSGHDIIAHRLSRRLIEQQTESESESVPLPPEEGVPLPNVLFGDRLTLSDTAMNVHLLHTPGHSEDSIVLWIDELAILFAGDTVEWPFPSFAQRDACDLYLRTLRQLNQLPVNLIVPGHGPVMGKEIIDHNQRYIEDVYDVVRTAKDSRIPRAELHLPVEEFAPKGVEIDDTYRQVHRENVEWAFDEV